LPSDQPITPEQHDGVVQALAGVGVALDGASTEALRLLASKRNVVLYGPPGTGKTRAALQVRDTWRQQNGDDSVVLTTFHPSYSYEDFVQGWRPDPAEDAQPSGFSLQPGVLLRAVAAAKEATELDPARKVLLLIDEINRGDVARIFGEVITFIEHDKRELDFTTAQDRTTEHQIPSNLYVLGTMNTADKSISLLDVALRRRFAFIPCLPNPGVFEASPNWLGEVGGVDIGELLRAINMRLQAQDIEIDRQVGHAMLSVDVTSEDPEQALIDRLFYDVLPLVEEYLYADRDSIRDVLPGLIDEDGVPQRPPSLAVLAPVLLPADEPSDGAVEGSADNFEELAGVDAEEDGD
jgi:5-methylcytosine-specific restriction protein B